MSTATFPGGLELKGSYAERKHKSYIGSFIQWCEGQSENRLFWLGLALMAHATVLLPATVLFVVSANQNFTLIMAALASMTLAVVTNLAALPTRITIPAFLLSIVIDVAVIVLSFTIS